MAIPARMAGVGVFVLGGLLLFAVGLFMIGDRQLAFAKKVTLYTEFKKITGLQPGAVVRVSGAKAGSITQIFSPDAPSGKFRVEVEIVEDLHQLVRTDSPVTIETEGLVGGNYLGISTGSDTAPIVAPNTVTAGKEPIDIAELVQRMGDTVTKVNSESVKSVKKLRELIKQKKPGDSVKMTVRRGTMIMTLSVTFGKKS